MPQVFGKVGRAQPTTVVSDTSQVQQRVTGYGDLVTTQLGDNHSALADEGSYFKACSVPGTPVAGALTQSFTATAPLLTITNGGTAGGKRIFIDYIRIIQNVIGASATSAQCVAVLEPLARTSTLGTNITPVNVNSDSTTASICGSTGFRFGAITAGAATASTRTILRHNFKIASAPVVGDMYSMDFGEHMSGAAALTGTTATVYPASVGPVAIGGGHVFLFYIWFPGIATTAPQYDFEVAWWER
jgi:hypothetical protein